MIVPQAWCLHLRPFHFAQPRMQPHCHLYRMAQYLLTVSYRLLSSRRGGKRKLKSLNRYPSYTTQSNISRSGPVLNSESPLIDTKNGEWGNMIWIFSLFIIQFPCLGKNLGPDLLSQLNQQLCRIWILYQLPRGLPASHHPSSIPRQHLKISFIKRSRGIWKRSHSDHGHITTCLQSSS